MTIRAPRVRFADFEADLRARELRKAGTLVRLQDQPFQILALLLARPGEVVTRDEMRAELWPDGTFVDFEHSLNAAIKRLRVALGDAAEQPRFVETLHRRGYRFVAPVIDDAPAASAPAAAPARRRLVVLPFANLGEADQGFFADGLTEDLISSLGRQCGGRIGVLARTSSWQFKDITRAPDDIARALDVDHLVEGSVRRDGERVRITATLVDARLGTQLWSDTYDRRVEDCLAVQADVAAHIARALALELLPPAPALLRSPATLNTAAYQAFLRGRYYWNLTGDDGLDEAVRCYDEAIALDPGFGKAWSARARAGIARCEYYLASPLDTLESVQRDAGRALEIDPGDSEGLVALAEVHRMLHWDWRAADEIYRRALALNPNSESTHRYYALFLAARGREDALQIVDRGWHLDPLCLTNNTAAASVRYFAGDYDAAIERCRMALDIDPTYGPARRRLASALAASGRHREALDEYGLVAPMRLDPVSRAWMGHTLAIAGNPSAARATAASLVRAVDGQTAPPFHLAILFAGLGDRDRAFELLDLACQGRDPALDTLDVEPRFQPLRGDRRFGALIARLKLDRDAVQSL